MTGRVLVDRIRRAAAWRPGPRLHTAEIHCPYCTQWRPARRFRHRALGCNGCVGNG